MLTKTLLRQIGCVLVSCLALSHPATASNGISDEEILFGQVAALAGPTAALGRSMQLGIEAAFQEANMNGGIGGRMLRLTSVDDGYEPQRTIDQVRSLIATEDVFAIIGSVGTPTARASLPITSAAGVPFIGPFTGAHFLRDSTTHSVINLRAGYSQEAEAWVKHLTEDLGYRDIAILYQDDDFGRSGLKGVKEALARRELTLIAEGTYKRNTTAVKSALLNIRSADPQAVVIFGAYQPAAEFIRLARQFKMDVTFVNTSFVGSAALAKELGEVGEGVFVTQVVPPPWDNPLPLAQKYLAALTNLQANAVADFVSFEGYVAGRLAIAALRRIDGDITRDKLMQAFNNMGSFELDGLPMTLGADDNQALDDVFLTVLDKDQRFRLVKRMTDTSD